jgi:hypothetical protein
MRAMPNHFGETIPNFEERVATLKTYAVYYVAYKQLEACIAKDRQAMLEGRADSQSA